MFALLAVITFAIGAFVAFSGSGSVSVAGLICVGGALLAMQLLWPEVRSYVRRS